ncbi:hypothetical protein EON73_05310 [bacterium]|nr:MAG: hypothetical protein EON73_05310 [bacterium]
MLLLVLSNNYLQLFFGWEAVGLSSYLLINFWHTRNLANTGALKAIIFNRVGDVFLLAAIAMIFVIFKTLNFSVVFAAVPQVVNKEWLGISSLELISFFLLLAAMAKSAQILLHPWLPDAMEGPTPVSSLLHSATMVTTGIFLIMRSSIIFSFSPNVSYLVAIIGLVTALFSSFTGLLQYDIKRIIAFSTCSQLGFMMFATGLGNYNFALGILFRNNSVFWCRIYKSLCQSFWR